MEKTGEKKKKKKGNISKWGKENRIKNSKTESNIF